MGDITVIAISGSWWAKNEWVSEAPDTITFLILPLSLSSKYPNGLFISVLTEVFIILSSTSNAKI